VITSNANFNGMDSSYIFKAAAEANEKSTITTAVVRDVVWMYLSEELGNVIGETYAEPQGRITVLTAPKCDGGENCASKAFTDVDRSEKSWSHEAIDWAVVKKVTNGMDATHFMPGRACTRAQAVTFLWRAMGEQEPTTKNNPFKDVSADAYYYKAVLWAAEKEITNGVSADKFDPDATCTRGQIVTFLWRAEGKTAAKTASTFSDVPAGAYFAPAVAWAVENGITNGTSATTFAPDDSCTRAHIVTFLYRDLGAK
jgi:hypothetical protein